MSRAIEAAKVLTAKTEEVTKKAKEAKTAIEDLVTATEEMARRADEGDEPATGTPEKVAVMAVEAMEKAVKEITEAATEAKTAILDIATSPNANTIATMGMTSLIQAIKSMESTTSGIVMIVRQAEKAITSARRESSGKMWNEAVEATEKALEVIKSADKVVSAIAMVGTATETMAVAIKTIKGY